MFPDHIELESKSNWRGGSGVKPPFYRRTWFLSLLALMVVAVLAVFIGVSLIVKPLREKAEAFDLNELRKLEAASIILDRNAEELFRLYMLNRTPVEFKEVPQHLVDALVSQEDSRYFSHNGVDYMGIARAVYLNFKAGQETQGASTITQQLARNTFNLSEKSYRRKLLEAFTAIRIEENFSKSQILELYLNRIYFGGGFYGIQAASNGYFGKDVKEISIQEAATLCGLIKSPNNIQPLRHPQRALKERNAVLDRMVTEGYLGREKARDLKLTPLITAPQEGDQRLSYIFDEVRRMVVEQVGEERAAIGGFQIYTSIDRTVQKAAEDAIRLRLSEVEQRQGYAHQTYEQYKQVIKDYRTKLNAGIISSDEPKPIPDYLQAASLVIDNDTGAILAMVGGRDFIDSQYNRAMNTRRPAGTAFVPFVFASAFSRNEFFPGSLVEDSYVSNRLVMIGAADGVLGEWGTEELNPQYSRSAISSREALAKGRNSATVNLAIQLGEEISRDNAVRGNTQQEILAAAKEINSLARECGIQSPMKEYQSVILGTNEVKLDEFCLAYTTFPNGGYRPQKLHLVERITDGDDNVVYQVDLENQPPVTAMDEIAAYQVHSCLTDALRTGTGKAAAAEFGMKDFPAAGKTGTHAEFKDLWFMGYTSSVTCGVWVGFDKQRPIYDGAFSSRIALPIWTDTINVIGELYPAEEIAPPPSAERMELCKKSGMKATDFCFDQVPQANGKIQAIRSTYSEYLRPGAHFDSYCTTHSAEGIIADILMFKPATSSSGGGSLADTGRYVHIEPVRMQGLTILGEDPYKAYQPIRRAIPVEEDGVEVKRAELVESQEEENETIPIRLSPPPRIFIEADKADL
jgi:membrane peptidoglycan carboxypeptidase